MSYCLNQYPTLDRRHHNLHLHRFPRGFGIIFVIIIFTVRTRGSYAVKKVLFTVRR